jgi:hypothetical protein
MRAIVTALLLALPATTLAQPSTSTSIYGPDGSYNGSAIQRGNSTSRCQPRFAVQ